MLRNKNPPNPQSVAVLNPRRQLKMNPRLKSPRPKNPRRRPLRNLPPRKSPSPKRKKSRRNPQRKAGRVLLLLLRRKLPRPPRLPKQTASRRLPNRSVNLLPLLLLLLMRTLERRSKSLLKRRPSVVVVRRLLKAVFNRCISAFMHLVSHRRSEYGSGLVSGVMFRGVFSLILYTQIKTMFNQ